MYRRGVGDGGSGVLPAPLHDNVGREAAVELTHDFGHLQPAGRADRCRVAPAGSRGRRHRGALRCVDAGRARSFSASTNAVGVAMASVGRGPARRRRGSMDQHLTARECRSL